MLGNDSLVIGDRAEKARHYSLSTFLTSIGTCSMLLAVSAGGFLAMCLFKPCRIMLQPRVYSHLNLDTRPLPLKPFQIFRQIVQITGQQIAHDCGIEAVLFDRHSQFLLLLFAPPAMILTPALGAFNYVVGSTEHSGDILKRLSWSNLSPDQAGYYWLYAGLVPCFTWYILLMITWELQRVVRICQQQFYQHPHATASSDYLSVAITNIPPCMREESEVRAYYKAWNESIVSVSFIHDRTRRDDLLARRQALVRHLERRETAFICEMVRRFGATEEQDFRRHLSERLSQRRVPSTLTRRWACLARWLPYCIRRTQWLYSELGAVHKMLYHEEDRCPKAPSRSALLGVNREDAARMIISHSPSVHAPFIRAKYLGRVQSQVDLSNMCGSSRAWEIRRECINQLTIILVVLWSIPVGASGFASQLSAAIRLLPSGYEWNLPGWFMGFFQGVLPQLVTSILMSTFPLTLRYLMTQKRYLTLREVQFSTQKFYFYFLFAQLFVNTSFSSGLLPTLVEIANDGITKIPRVLAQNLPLSNTYFLSYITLHAASVAMSFFIRPTALFELYRRRRSCRSPKDIISGLYSLHDVVRWGEIYPPYSMIANIVIVYALLAPLIIPIAVLSFGCTRICFRYTLLYKSKMEIDTHGQLYFQAIFHLFWGVFTLELCFLGLFILKTDVQSLGHDLGQIIIVLFTLISTVHYYALLKRLYRPLLRRLEIGFPEAAPCIDQLEGQESHQLSVREKFRAQTKGFPNLHRLQAIDGTMWLPKDPVGVSDALSDIIRDMIHSTPTGGFGVTNSAAIMTNRGQVVLQNEVTSFVDGLEHLGRNV